MKTALCVFQKLSPSAFLLFKTKLGIETVSSRLLQKVAKPAKTAVSTTVSPRSSLLVIVSKLEN